MVPLFLLAAGGWLLLAGCSARHEIQTIKLPPTPILTLPENWALVNSPQLRLREGPSISTPALITLWKGYVIEVIKRNEQPETIGDHTDYWYYINYKGLRGWVYGQYLIMYDSRQRAEQASKELLK